MGYGNIIYFEKYTGTYLGKHSNKQIKEVRNRIPLRSKGRDRKTEAQLLTKHLSLRQPQQFVVGVL